MARSQNASGRDSLLSPRGFTKRVQRLFEKHEPTATITSPKPLHLVVSRQGKEQYKAFLGNVYTDYQMMPGLLEKIVTRYVEATMAALNVDPTSLDINRLVPVVKDWGFIEHARKMVGVSGTPDDEIMQTFERYNDSLVVVYAEDSNHTIKYPAWETIAQAGLEMAQLRPLAVENLQRIMPPMQTLKFERNLYGIMAGGSYEASLILIDSIWQERKFEADGDYVIAMPARGYVFITGSQARSVIPRVRHMAVDAHRDSPYPLTDQLFIYDGAKFVEYDK